MPHLTASLSARLPALAAVVLAAVVAPGWVIDDWQYRHPVPHSQTLWRVAHGGGMYVMTGDNGVLTTSSDLENWQSTFYPEFFGLEGVLYANGGFLVTSWSGVVLTSPDGRDWTAWETGTFMGLLGAAYGNGRYVLVGEEGTTATSTDGENWTISDTGDNGWYFGVAYGNVGGTGLFVAASIDDLDTGAIATSTDGVNWTRVNLPGNFPGYIEFYDVSYGNGKFIASGYFYDEATDDYGMFIATSANGTTWTRATNGVPVANFNEPAFVPTALNMTLYNPAQGLWLGVGDLGVLMTSPDGVNWTETYPLGDNTTDMYGIALSPQGRVIVGDLAQIYFSPSGTSAWELKTQGSYTVTLADIAYNGALYVAAGSAILTSADGIDWQTQVATNPGGTLSKVVYGKSRWVAGSRNTTSQTPLLTSLDGITWAAPPTLPAGFTGCQDLAFGNGTFVALPQSGTFSFFTSTDGQTWTGRNHSWFNGRIGRTYISYGNGQFLAFSRIGSTLEIATSANGINWQTANTSLTGTYTDAAYGGGRWVLVGDAGRVATSTNLTDWSEQVITFYGADPVRLEGVAYGKGQWVVCGAAKSVWSSEDGQTWTPAFAAGYDAELDVFNAVMFDSLSFWTVGSFGDILETGPLLGPATLSILPMSMPGNVLLRIEGDPGDRWNILSATSLSATTWSVLASINLENGTGIYIAPVSGNKFYRLAPPQTPNGP